MCMYGACIDDDGMFLIMEWMEGGSLYHALGSHIVRPLPPRQRISIARDITDGLQYLHSTGILHRDIKSLNVLLSADGRAKLCDFGLATLRTLTTTTATTSGRQALGTFAWSAPEIIISGAKHNEKCDVYSLGIIMWELLTCDVPFGDCDIAQITARLRNSERPEIPSPLPGGFPPSYVELMKRCWQQVTSLVAISCRSKMSSSDFIYRRTPPSDPTHARLWMRLLPSMRAPTSTVQCGCIPMDTACVHLPRLCRSSQLRSPTQACSRCCSKLSSVSIISHLAPCSSAR
jgi:serine/threonine protein kinase